VVGDEGAAVWCLGCEAECGEGEERRSAGCIFAILRMMRAWMRVEIVG